jgi:glycosyltransferase EpsF
VHRHRPGHYDDEIGQLGGRIFRIPSLGTSTPFTYLQKFCRVLSQQGPFLAIHAHNDLHSGMACLAGRLGGVPRRICHSHNTAWEWRGTVGRKIAVKFLRWLIHKYATDYCACGRSAADAMFGIGTKSKRRVTIIPNAIDLSLFRVRTGNQRNLLINEHRVPGDSIVIGHVGRFFPVKNHLFLIKLAEEFKERGIPAVFILAGDGPQKDQIQLLAGQSGAANCFRFLGVRSDIPEIMAGFDVLVLPSLHEGLPLVLIEAQAAGLPCVISDAVTEEADLGLGLVTRIGLQESMDRWILEIQQAAARNAPSPDTILSALTKSGYNAAANVGNWLSLYGLVG